MQLRLALKHQDRSHVGSVLQLASAFCHVPRTVHALMKDPGLNPFEFSPDPLYWQRSRYLHCLESAASCSSRYSNSIADWAVT